MRAIFTLFFVLSPAIAMPVHGDDLNDILNAAENDNIQAQVVLGAMHEHGMGVALNDTRSAYWWQRALDNGYWEIAKALGSMYFSGRGVPLDYEKAMELYLLAAEHGHPHAIKFVALGQREVVAVSVAAGTVADHADEGRGLILNFQSFRHLIGEGSEVI